MKVVAIEIAEAIEKEINSFLKDGGGGYQMRFTRFIDLGGKQVDLYLYPASPGASPWSIIRIKSVVRSEQGECMQYFVNLPSSGKAMDDVLIAPEKGNLPSLADKVLQFLKSDLLELIRSEGGALNGGQRTLDLGEKADGMDKPKDDTEEVEGLKGMDRSGASTQDVE